MRFSKRAGFILVILLVTGLGAGYWVYRQGSGFFSDPRKARTNAVYEAVFASSTGMTLERTNLIAFGDSIVETNQTEVRVRTKESVGNAKKPELPFTLHSATGTNAIEIGGGTVRLSYFLTGWAAPKTNFDYGLRIPGSIYGADLRPMESNEITLNKWERELQVQGDFPSAKFYFGVTNIPNFKLVKFQVFDGRTKRSVSSGTSSSWIANAFWVETEIQLWYQTPIEVVSTIALGPNELFEAKSEQGTEIYFPGGALKLICIVPQGINGWGSSSDGTTNITTLSLNENPVASRTNESSFVFSVWPHAMEMPIDLELLDESGKKLDNTGGGSSDRILISSVAAKMEEVKTIRVRYYPKLHRIVWTVPELPGLPEENRNVKNLFDTRVPYMRFRYEHDYQAHLRQLVAMEMNYTHIQYPNGFFPLTKTNFTPRDLLRDMESRLPNQQQLWANSKENKIELRRSTWEIVVERVKKVFGR